MNKILRGGRGSCKTPIEQALSHIYECTWSLDERMLALEDNISSYYSEVEDLDNKQAMIKWKKLKQRCYGIYTQKEINLAKRRVQSRRPRSD
jgi:hypothetical protein